MIAIASMEGFLDSQWSAALSAGHRTELPAVFGYEPEGPRVLPAPLPSAAAFQECALKDDLLDTSNAKIIVLGMGRIGSGAYRALRERYGDAVLVWMTTISSWRPAVAAASGSSPQTPAIRHSGPGQTRRRRTMLLA